MERRGRIPVAKFRTQEGKTRSRSRVREPDYNEQAPEADLFTLLEDNIALKEENKALKLKIEDHHKIQNELLEENAGMRDKLVLLKKEQENFQAQMKEIATQNAKTKTERNALDKLHKMRVDQISSLTNELEKLQRNQQNLSTSVIESISLKRKLLKILPNLAIDNQADGNEMESLIDVEATIATPITSELLERLVNEFFTLKNSMNSVELQLYEANEKLSELLENQHHLEEENITLRTENTNLTKVAKLLTENMKESVETSKKMETALIKLKQRNDELAAKARDLTDGPVTTPSPTTLQSNAEFEQMAAEVHNQNRDHGERIVEMKSLMDAAIQKNTNDELKILKLKLEILEGELVKAIARAESAESELEKYKNCAQTETNATAASAPTPIQLPPPPPPPAPPLPATLLYKPPTGLHAIFPSKAQQLLSGGGGDVEQGSFSDSIAARSQQKRNGDKIIDTVMHQVQPEAATGLDALMREFKSGRVTLRRHRRKTRTNDALQEMFQVLEISQKQNRNSNICIDMHI